MDFQTRKTIESKEFPGVSFILRTISYGRRMRVQAKIDAIFTEAGILPKAREGDYTPDETRRVILLEPQLDGVYFGEMLVGVRGLVVDGTSFDNLLESTERDTRLAAFLEDAPEALVREIGRAIREEYRLTPEAEKNSNSPGAPASTPGEEPKQ